jgi:hypothetical protein
MLNGRLPLLLVLSFKPVVITIKTTPYLFEATQISKAARVGKRAYDRIPEFGRVSLVL